MRFVTLLLPLALLAGCATAGGVTINTNGKHDVVSASGEEVVNAGQGSTVFAHAHSVIWAHWRSQVIAYEGSTVHALSGSDVHAFQGSIVYAEPKSYVEVCGSVELHASPGAYINRSTASVCLD
ncbi:MAG TPA: hypothetical protein V6C81_12220 [Planktothrix sp.]